MRYELDKLKLNNIINGLKNQYRSNKFGGRIKVSAMIQLDDEAFRVAPTYNAYLDAVNNFEIVRLDRGYIIGCILPSRLDFEEVTIPDPDNIESSINIMKESEKIYNELVLKYSDDMLILSQGGHLSTSSVIYKEALKIIEKVKSDMWICPRILTSVSGGPVRPPKNMIPIYNIDSVSGDVYTIQSGRSGTKDKFYRYPHNINTFTNTDISLTCKKIRWSGINLQLKGDITHLGKFLQARVDY